MKESISRIKKKMNVLKRETIEKIDRLTLAEFLGDDNKVFYF